MDLVGCFAAGAAAGAVHVLAGPDHLAAVAAVGGGPRRRAWSVGARWGAGHALGVAALAAVAAAGRGLIAPAAISAWGERLVGAALVGVGAWGLARAAARWVQSHPHHHGDRVHTHVHLHAPGAAGRPATEHAHSHAALLIGALHGVAGGSHVLALLPALVVPGRSAAVTYLAGLAFGTVAAMIAFAGAVGGLVDQLGRRRPRAAIAALGTLSAAAVGLGIVWALP